MAAEVNGADIPNWVIIFGSTVVTAVAGFALGLVNRGPAMQLAINSAVEPLLTGYKQRVDELVAEVHALRTEIVVLRKSLDDAKVAPGLGV